MPFYELVGVNEYPATDKVQCELCGNHIQYQYIFAGNGDFGKEGGEVIYGGSARVGVECAKKITGNDKFPELVSDIEKIVKHLRRIASTEGTMIQIEGEPTKLTLYVRERTKKRFVRTPHRISDAQFIMLKAALKIELEVFKTYRLNQIIPITQP